MKFRMVEELALEQQDVAQTCRILECSRSGYYEWLVRPLSIRLQENLILSEKIKALWEESRKTYGLPRILRKLRESSPRLGKSRVVRLMKKNGVEGVGRKKFKPMTTTSKHDGPIAERVFQTENRSSQVTHANQYWGGDITYVETGEGWLYLAIVLDLFTRKVVGHAMDEAMPAELVMRALEMGVRRQGLPVENRLTVHTDRGSQYAAEKYREDLLKHGLIASMSRKGNCYDNALVESFFRTLKVELVYRGKFKTRKEAMAAIFEFIEVWYNRQRIHSAIDYMTPEEYEVKHSSAA